MTAITPDMQRSSQKSVIVYGPQGCGKTRFAEVLRKHFLLDAVLELDEQPRPFAFPTVGALCLTNKTREELVADRTIDAAARRVFSFEEALDQVNNADTLSWFNTDITDGNVQVTLKAAANSLVGFCHAASVNAGWWSGTMGGLHAATALELVRADNRVGKALVAEKLCLIHSEVSEAMEGHRKGLQDDKLPQRKMIEVELADALIRICDLAGALQLDLGGAVAEKMAYNAIRPDHKKEARESAGGKAY